MEKKITIQEIERNEKKLIDALREKGLILPVDEKQNEPKDSKENNPIDPHRCENNQYPGFPFIP